MLDILEKIESKVICIIDDKQFHYSNGKDAYQQLSNNYSILSITSNNDCIIIKLKLVEKNTKEWEEAYKKQFGKEPSFF